MIKPLAQHNTIRNRLKLPLWKKPAQDKVPTNDSLKKESEGEKCIPGNVNSRNDKDMF